MLTAMLSPPGAARRTWSLLAAILVGLFAFTALVSASPPLELELGFATEAPPLIAPVAVLALAGVVGYALSDRLLRTKTTTLLTIFALAFLAMVFHAGAAALAQAADPANGVVQPTESTVITIDTVTLSFLVGSVMPLLTALATKLTASPTVKGVVNLLLSVAGGVLAAFVTNSGSLTYQEIAAAAIATYLSAQAVYAGVLRPALAPKVAAIAPNSGVG